MSLPELIDVTTVCCTAGILVTAGKEVIATGWELTASLLDGTIVVGSIKTPLLETETIGIEVIAPACELAAFLELVGIISGCELLGDGATVTGKELPAVACELSRALLEVDEMTVDCTAAPLDKGSNDVIATVCIGMISLIEVDGSKSTTLVGKMEELVTVSGLISLLNIDGIVMVWVITGVVLLGMTPAELDRYTAADTLVTPTFGL